MRNTEPPLYTEIQRDLWVDPRLEDLALNLGSLNLRSGAQAPNHHCHGHPGSPDPQAIRSRPQRLRVPPNTRVSSPPETQSPRAPLRDFNSVTSVCCHCCELRSRPNTTQMPDNQLAPDPPPQYNALNNIILRCSFIDVDNIGGYSWQFVLPLECCRTWRVCLSLSVSESPFPTQPCCMFHHSQRSHI